MIQAKGQIFGADCCDKTTLTKGTEQEIEQKALQKNLSCRNELADANYLNEKTIANGFQEKAATSTQCCVIVLNAAELNRKWRSLHAA